MTTAYCIKGPQGEFYPLTVRMEPDLSILAYREYDLSPWPELAAWGWEVVKVKLVEESDANQG